MVEQQSSASDIEAIALFSAIESGIQRDERGLRFIPVGRMRITLDEKQFLEVIEASQSLAERIRNGQYDGRVIRRELRRNPLFALALDAASKVGTR
ncbi:MAG: hypothetical protein WCJ29_05755 [bacterium]